MAKWITMLIVGVVLALGPIWGVVGTIFGMIKAFGHLAESRPQVGTLAGDINLALHSTAAGYIICPFGIILIVIAAVRMSNHEQQRQAE